METGEGRGALKFGRGIIGDSSSTDIPFPAVLGPLEPGKSLVQIQVDSFRQQGLPHSKGTNDLLSGETSEDICTTTTPTAGCSTHSNGLAAEYYIYS